METSMQVYGSNQEITTMASRFKVALRGGDKLNNNELYALAQIAKVTSLNPFNGEIWYIPGKGTMVGIAGARRLWQEQSKAGGGFSFVEIIPCPPEEAGATEADVVAAFKAIAHDSRATRDYQKLFSDTLASLRASGSTDPVKEAREIVGPRPEWTGYGYSTKSETSRMNKTQLARKRAEADALKKCVVLPFGVEVSTQDTAPQYAPDYVEAVVTDAVDGIASGTNIPRNDTTPARPYSPEQLKAKLAEMKVQLSQYALKGTEAQTITLNLSDCFGGNDDKRHAVIFYLTGKESLKDVDGDTLKALKKWINPQKTESGWVMDSMAIKEAHAVYAQAMKEQGQMEMEGV